MCVRAAKLRVSRFHALCVLAEVRASAREKQMNQFIINSRTLVTEVLFAGACWNKHSVSELIIFEENLGKTK